MKIIIFLALLCIVSAKLHLPRLPRSQRAVVADPPLPTTPLQFTANIKYTEGGDFPESFTGVVFYDFINQIVRFDFSYEGDTSTEINDFLNGVEVTWDTQYQDCYCEPPFGAMEVMFIPYGAVYAGQGFIGINPVTIWNFTDPSEELEIIYQFNIDPFHTVLRMAIYEIEDDFTYSYVIDFSNITLGQPDTGSYVIPDFCKCDLPLPPPPSPGTCPNSGDTELCTCAKSTDLSFCTLVNYPISAQLDVAKVDLFVAQTYNSTISTLTNPSPQCLANFQAYLCSFYFGICGEEEDDSNYEYATYLPCASTCTSCSCGDSPLPLNCTAAPAAASYCTLYGGKPFC